MRQNINLMKVMPPGAQGKKHWCALTDTWFCCFDKERCLLSQSHSAFCIHTHSGWAPAKNPQGSAFNAVSIVNFSKARTLNHHLLKTFYWETKHPRGCLKCLIESLGNKNKRKWFYKLLNRQDALNELRMWSISECMNMANTSIQEALQSSMCKLFGIGDYLEEVRGR